MQDCRLAAEDLACRRGERLLFAGLGFDLRPGGAIQVIGANGTGKSSLIRILAGLLRPLAGSVVRHGAAGLVDEHLALDAEVPLGSALAFWSGIDGAALGAVDRLGLADLLDVRVGYLSTGQRKRASLARLLNQDAPIWLLDEPLNGLDQEACRLVENLAAAHCRDGGICVIASHQPFELPGRRMVDLADFAP